MSNAQSGETSFPVTGRARTMTFASGVFETPMVWLGQSIRTSVISASVPELRDAPLMVSLGDALHRPRTLDRVFGAKMRRQLGVTGPIMLDSGGYTLLNRPEIDWSPEWVSEIYKRVDADLFVALDHPPALKERRKDRRSKYALTLRNLEKLVAYLPSANLVPVIHGRTIDELEQNCAATKEYLPRPFMIGLGGLVPLLRRSGSDKLSDPRSTKAFLVRALGTIRRHFQDAMIHVFGVGSPMTMLGLFAWGADSVDSIGWRRAAGYGTIFLPGRGERFVAVNPFRQRQSRPIIDEIDRTLLRCCSCPACVRFDQIEDRIANLADDYRPRAIHNAWTLLSEAASLRQAGATEESRQIFLGAKLSNSWRTHDMRS